VGKTTTTINLGAYLAKAGKRVLLVDLDPQANATSCLGVDKAGQAGGTYEALIGQKTVNSFILRNQNYQLSLLPSSQALAGAEVELVSEFQREFRLRDALAPIEDYYDYILIDCPPSLGLLTVNGLLAAKDGVIIPIQCEFLALEGLTQLMGTIQRIQRVFRELSIRGMLLTMYDGRTNLASDVRDEVRGHFPELVFDTIIPRSIKLAEAPSFGQPISLYAPDSTGAKAYQALASEVITDDEIEKDVDAAG
jgi:chromosome partitioning protein